MIKSISRIRNKQMLEKKAKEKIIKKFQTHANDTGSSQVQIAILIAEIEELTEHLKKHDPDFSSRRGLLRKVSERRRLLKYLQKEDQKAFQDLATKLKLKINKKIIEIEKEKELKEQELEKMIKGENDEEEVD